jgi:FkbH-like protein
MKWLRNPRVELMRFLELKKNLKRDYSGMKMLRVAVLGDSATQLLVQAVRGYGFEAHLDLQIFEADYDQIDRQIMDLSSDLYSFQPEYVFLSITAPKLLKKFYGTKISRRAQFSLEEADRIRVLVGQLNRNIHRVKIILGNFMEINDSVFGQYANKAPASFLYQVRRLNGELMTLAEQTKNLFICDIAALTAEFGQNASVDNRNRIEADMAFSLDFLPCLAKAVVDIIQAISGTAKKCLVLDLDNTVWGGVLGDDGVENIQVGYLGQGKAFTELQYWAKELKQRGILIAVCSKNDESVAKVPFEMHEDMVLSLDDIAIFVANWDSKVDNIKRIKSFLNIGYDAMVFVDDNPYERGVVRHHLPEVCVPELPEDPSDYLPFLRSLNLFETASYTEEDGQRTAHFQQELKREQVQKAFTDERGFLQSLGMTAQIDPIEKFNIPRVAQLIQRSNQFNLRTIRYTEEDLSRLGSSPQHLTKAVSIRDQFGNYGLISAIIGEYRANELFIDTWVMSCRVLKRGVEYLVLNDLAATAARRGTKRIVGEFCPTRKNALVKDHYQNLGFSDAGDGLWTLEIEDFLPREHFITALNSELV